MASLKLIDRYFNPPPHPLRPELPLATGDGPDDPLIGGFLEVRRKIAAESQSSEAL